MFDTLEVKKTILYLWPYDTLIGLISKYLPTDDYIYMGMRNQTLMVCS